MPIDMYDRPQWQLVTTAELPFLEFNANTGEVRMNVHGAVRRAQERHAEAEALKAKIDQIAERHPKEGA